MRRSHGFFLIEILIALSLILIISSIAIPNLHFLNQQVVASDLERLNMAFYYMQQSAITENKDLSLKFENSGYDFDSFNEKLSNNVEFGIIDGVKGPPAFPTKKITEPITFQKNEVTFYKNGQIQPGTAYIVDKQKRYLYSITVPVSQISFIRKYKFNNNKWNLIN